MARDYVCLYHSYLDAIQALDDAERGRLLTAMLEYSIMGVTVLLDGNERFIFPMVKAQIDRDKVKYERQCQRNAENGKTGGRPKKQKNPLGFFESEKSQGKGKGEREGKDIPPQSPPGELFSRFWAMYPRKTAKQNALRAFERLNVTEALLTEMLAALAWQRRCEDWTKEGGKFIPYPATWLNQHRWEDEPPDKEDDPYDNVIT